MEHTFAIEVGAVAPFNLEFLQTLAMYRSTSGAMVSNRLATYVPCPYASSSSFSPSTKLQHLLIRVSFSAIKGFARSIPESKIATLTLASCSLGLSMNRLTPFCNFSNLILAGSLAYVRGKLLKANACTYLSLTAVRVVDGSMDSESNSTSELSGSNLEELISSWFMISEI